MFCSVIPFSASFAYVKWILVECRYLLENLLAFPNRIWQVLCCKFFSDRHHRTTDLVNTSELTYQNTLFHASICIPSSQSRCGHMCPVVSLLTCSGHPWHPSYSTRVNTGRDVMLLYIVSLLWNDILCIYVYMFEGLCYSNNFNKF